MPTWLIWTAAIATIDALLLIWNHGAHRKPDPDEFRRIRSLSWRGLP